MIFLHPMGLFRTPENLTFSSSPCKRTFCPLIAACALLLWVKSCPITSEAFNFWMQRYLVVKNNTREVPVFQKNHKEITWRGRAVLSSIPWIDAVCHWAHEVSNKQFAAKHRGACVSAWKAHGARAAFSSAALAKSIFMNAKCLHFPALPLYAYKSVPAPCHNINLVCCTIFLT